MRLPEIGTAAAYARALVSDQSSWPSAKASDAAYGGAVLPVGMLGPKTHNRPSSWGSTCRRDVSGRKNFQATAPFCALTTTNCLRERRMTLSPFTSKIDSGSRNFDGSNEYSESEDALL